jgi:hypothetical protein
MLLEEFLDIYEEEEERWKQIRQFELSLNDYELFIFKSEFKNKPWLEYEVTMAGDEEWKEIINYLKVTFEKEILEEIIKCDFENKYCLPYRESIQRSNIYAKSFDHRRKSDYHKVDGYYPYKRIKRILENNVGKSFDGAFSYYCRKSPKYQQKLFDETINRNWSRRWGKDYIIDDNGLIQGNPDRHKKWYNWINPPYKVKSWDHKGENQWIHNITGQIGFEPYSWEDVIEFRKKHKFKYITTQGKIYEFESKDYKYHRCKKEQEQKRKKYNRQLPD